ncbi:MAG: mechanosensitive ion channel [Saprospiraceae bacterium]|nr:mechanosensitive ion channel [Saprospiraceae bacterium]
MKIGTYSLTVVQVAYALVILFFAWLTTLIITSVVRRYFRRKHLDIGRYYSVSRLISYVIYVIAILISFQALGIHLSVIWAGAAALLVGLGFGLQHIFNDLVSGIVLLIEGTVAVNDVVIVEGIVGIVRAIGLRTSKVETRDKVVIIIPNSKLVSENVTNWSHNDATTRFQVKVGVSYASDVDLVERLMLKAGADHPQVEHSPAPKVAFEEFADSSLNFTLYFFSEEFLAIEFVKSDLRFAITRLFREHGIVIPFPQRDLWIRNPESLHSES